MTNKIEKNKKNFKSKKTLICISTGAISGLINGLFGGGGGMVVVPMLTKFLKYNQKQSHATAILIILPLSIVSGLFYCIFGNFNFETGLPVIIGVVLGGIVGALLLSKLSSKWLVLIFSILMAIAGAKMLLF